MTWNVALVEAAATVADAGTLKELLLSEIVITAPAGAGWDSDDVRDDDAPGDSEVGGH